MPVIEIKTKEDFAKYLKAEKPAVVDFTAVWCGPCQLIKPYFHEISEHDDYKEKILFLQVDVDELEDVAADAGVRAMPTFQLYKNGKKANELVGASKEKLEALIKEALTEKAAAAETKEEKKEDKEEEKKEKKKEDKKDEKKEEKKEEKK